MSAHLILYHAWKHLYDERISCRLGSKPYDVLTDAILIIEAAISRVRHGES